MPSFLELYNEEQRVIEAAPDPGAIASPEEVEEPRIIYTPQERVGLALSGGGIRSATFNLGLLQGLNSLKLLPIINYLSTVSGGSYIGGWWTCWRCRVGHRDGLGDVPFPPTGAGVEPPEVRHLREFNKFLAPRVGFLEIETWNAVVVVLGGMLVSLAAANAVLMGGMFCWGVLAICLLKTPLAVSTAIFSFLTAAILSLLERRWQERKNRPRLRAAAAFGERRFENVVCTALPVVFACVIWHLWRDPNAGPSFRSLLSASTWREAWSAIVMNLPPQLYQKEGLWLAWDSLLFPGVVWCEAALLMMLVRFLSSRWQRQRAWAAGPAGANPPNRRTPMRLWGRTTGRLLGLAATWCVLTLVGTASLHAEHFGKLGAAIVAATALVPSALFGWARCRQPPTLRAETRRASDKLRPLVPQVLAYVALAAGTVLATHGMLFLIHRYGLSWFFCTWAVFALVFLFCFDPEVMGLHAFYRARIVRTYLGASNPYAVNSEEQNVEDATSNRQADRQRGDDVPLEATIRPGPGGRLPGLVHLVCCTANGLSDDPLATLSRGGRSAVLSGHGMLIGNCWGVANPPGLRMSTALTASGAAFNTCMGSASMRLGPAVRFMMAALNLRLGVWLRHPGDGRTSPLFPGWLFLREMFGWVSCARMTHDRTTASVHLSDGGHFENLGLYELVRRHCRYIIVSDAGADPELAFDDFGNAVRRIREDFGVEIEIDIDPLRPDTKGHAKQHMVAGTISYNPQGKPNDCGILLYFKSVLLGDEPDDITQYKCRNSAFPHETTGDQFYDEAQWEAYRRLGELSVKAALGFLDPKRKLDASDAAAVFTQAHRRLQASPPGLHEEHDRLRGLYGQFEGRLLREGPRFLFNELFPETAAVDHTPQPHGEIAEALGPLLEVTRLMEDVVTCCQLDRHARHPLNIGWFNLFQRWVLSRSFRIWWPVIKPLHGPRLPDFVERRLRFLHVPPAKQAISRHEVSTGAVLPPGPATECWRRFREVPPRGTVYSCILTLADDTEQFDVQVGLVQVEFRAPQTAFWDSRDFFVLPGLWGTEIARGFLRDVVQQAWNAKLNRCEVGLQDHGAGGLATDALHADLIEFYLGAGFRLTEDCKCLVLAGSDRVQPGAGA